MAAVPALKNQYSCLCAASQAASICKDCLKACLKQLQATHFPTKTKVPIKAMRSVSFSIGSDITITTRSKALLVNLALERLKDCQSATRQD